MADDKLGLRERKKLDTRWALSDAALELAFEKGLDHVTRDEIAARAGVSLRTFNNYFTGKYEAVAYRQLERMRRSLYAFRAQPAEMPLWSAIADAVLEPLVAEAADDLLPTPRQQAVIRDLIVARGVSGRSFQGPVRRVGRGGGPAHRNRPGAGHVPAARRRGHPRGR